MATIHGEEKALLNLSEGNRTGREGANARGRPGVPAKRIDCVAAWKEQQREQNGAERPKGSIGLLHLFPLKAAPARGARESPHCVGIPFSVISGLVSGPDDTNCHQACIIGFRFPDCV